MSVYAADGSFRISVVEGNVYTGVYNEDQSINVVESPGSGWVGVYHPCGALYVTLVSSGQVGFNASDGSINVCVSPYTPKGAVPVTVVSGSLGETEPGGAGSPMGLLLTLTYAA